MSYLDKEGLKYYTNQIFKKLLSKQDKISTGKGITLSDGIISGASNTDDIVIKDTDQTLTSKFNDIDTSISTISDELTDYVKIVTFTENMTFNANGITTVSFSSVAIPDGYKFLQYVGGRTGNTGVFYTCITTGGITSKYMTPSAAYYSVNSSLVTADAMLYAILIRK